MPKLVSSKSMFMVKGPPLDEKPDKPLAKGGLTDYKKNYDKRFCRIMDMVQSRMVILLMIIAAGLPAAGCQSPSQSPGSAVARFAAETPEDYCYLWDAATGALRRYSFRLDRQDRLEGIITTHRDTTGNWFEWWRWQPRSPHDWMETNIHTIQRKAQVRIRPSDKAGVYDLDVQVDRYRHSLEERQVDNSAGALRLYSGAAPTAYGKMVKPAESSYWIHRGRDGPMEQAILTSIIKRYDPSCVTDMP